MSTSTAQIAGPLASATPHLEAPRQLSRIQQWILVCVLGLIVMSLTFALRSYNLGTAYDIFIDEVTYLRISEGVQSTQQVSLYGKPFYLHPPVYFFLEAAYLNLAPPQTDEIQKLFVSRNLNVLIASFSALMLFLTGRRIAGWPYGLLAALLFAIDPFIIRMNSRNIIDTSATFWILVGYCAFITGYDEDKKRLYSSRIFVVGFAFGLAALSKDMTVFLTGVPIVIMLLIGWPIRRFASFAVGITMVLTYSVYIIAIYLSGDIDTFLNSKFSGVLRLVGVDKATGVTRADGPGLVQTLISKINEFGITYVVIGLGGLAVLFLLWRGRSLYRFVGLWGFCAYLLLGYCVVLGSLEEQFFYLLVVPALLVLTLACAQLMRFKLPVLITRLLYLGILLALCIFSAWSMQEWIARHLLPDNSYETVIRFAKDTYTYKAKVSSTSETAQFLLGPQAAAPWGNWYHVEDIVRDKPDFVILAVDQVKWDHGTQANELIDWLNNQATNVYDLKARTNHLILYQMPWSTIK